MTTWTNEDGLLVRYALDDGAKVADDGLSLAQEHMLRVRVPDATLLADADTAAEAGDRPFIPSGAVIQEAYFRVDTAFTSGGSAVLDLGTKLAAGTTVDDDGIDAAVAVAGLTANAVIQSDGAQIPAKATADWYPTITYDTAAFTAGAGELVIKYVL